VNCVICVLCTRTRAFRRGLCRSCHRKLSACGVPLPVHRGGPWTLARWVRRWPAETRAAFLAAAESTGAQFYSDGVFLDMEDTSGPEAEALAVGIVVRVLVNRGFTLTIVPDNTPCDGDEDSPPPEPQGDA